MAAFTFGDTSLFAVGCVEQTLYSPYTGDVIGYTKLLNDFASNYTFDLIDFTGFRGALVMSVPSNTRLTGECTSTDFSLAQRARISGSELTYNAVGKVCETITATSTSLTVTRTPAKAYMQPKGDTEGWAYVHEANAGSYQGTCYHVDLSSKVITDFTATIGKTYEVTYFTNIASAQSVALQSAANPDMVSVDQSIAIYSNNNGTVANGTIYGHLHLIVPLAVLSGNAGVDGNQTTGSTTPYSWNAFVPNATLPNCDDCQSTNDAYAYLVFVPCGEVTQNVKGIAVLGGGVTVPGVGETAKVQARYIMPNDSLVMPDYSDLTFETIAGTGAGDADIAADGTVTGVAQGDINAKVTVTGTDISSIFVIEIEGE